MGIYGLNVIVFIAFNDSYNSEILQRNLRGCVLPVLVPPPKSLYIIYRAHPSPYIVYIWASLYSILRGWGSTGNKQTVKSRFLKKEFTYCRLRRKRSGQIFKNNWTVRTLLSELGRPDYLSHSPIPELASPSHLSLSYLFFYINTLVGCVTRHHIPSYII